MKSFKVLTESNWKKSYEREEADLSNLHDSLLNHYKPLDDYQHADAVNDYTGHSRPVNNHLWQQHGASAIKTGSDETDHEWNIKTLDHVLQAHKTPHPITVFSGIRYDPRKKMNSEGIVHHPAYLSTSISKLRAKGFGTTHENQYDQYGIRQHHVLKIRVPKGHSGIYAYNHSQAREEREFILPRGLNLRHIRTTEHHVNRQSFFDPYTVHEYHMEIVK